MQEAQQESEPEAKGLANPEAEVEDTPEEIVEEEPEVSEDLEEDVEDEEDSSEDNFEEDQEQTDVVEEAQQPQTFTVKVDGQEVEVTQEELINGYSRQQDYTRKTQELAHQRKPLSSSKQS